MNAKVYRFNPETDKEAYYDEFQIEYTAENRMTVMNLLEHIGNHLDGTISFFMHSACGQGICGRCAVKVNGKIVLSCNTVLTGEDIVIEPAGGQIIKDLVILK